MSGSSPSDSPQGEGASGRWTAVVLGFTAALFGLLTWNHGFVWDDELLVVGNALTGSWRHAPTWFAVDLWASAPSDAAVSGYYRPLLLADLALDRLIGGLSPRIHHLHSVAWHVLAVAAVGRLAKRRGLTGWAVVLAMVVAGLHPLVVEGVVFVAARNDVMAAALLGWGLWGLLRPELRPVDLAVGGFLVLLAALSKESALLAPLLLVALYLARDRRLPPRSAVLATIAPLGVYGLLRLMAGVGLPPGADLWSAAPGLLDAAGWTIAGLVDYGELLPGRNIHCAAVEGPAWPWLLAGLAGSAVTVALGGRLAAGGLVWVALTWAPALGGIAQNGLVADRYTTLPMLGLALALGAASRRLPARTLPLLVGGLGLVWSASSARLIGHWQSQASLWPAAIAAHPTAYTHGTWAKELEVMGELDAAAWHYARAVFPPQQVDGPGSCWPLAHSCFNIVGVHLMRARSAEAAAAGGAPDAELYRAQAWDAWVDAVEIGLASIGSPAPSALPRFSPPSDRVDLADQGSCAASSELLGRLSLALAMTGTWDAAAELAEVAVSSELGDLTGYAKLVLIAEGLGRGDEASLHRFASPEQQDEARARALALRSRSDRLVLWVRSAVAPPGVPGPG